MNILRDMACENEGQGSLDYQAFKSRLNAKRFTDKQNEPLNLRLALLESFMRRMNKSGPGGKPTWELLDDSGDDDLQGNPGTLTIIDLTDPVIDADFACVLFDICLSVFLSQTKCGKIVALDEAHNYMTEGSSAAGAFTNKLLSTVRQQRHQATRLVIATQEPTINTALLDLCNITMVHRCTSPAWFAVLKKHLAALFLASLTSDSNNKTEDDETDFEAHDDKTLFHKIVKLTLGESLLFCPNAAIGIDEKGKVEKLFGNYVHFKTRERITSDGGQSKYATTSNEVNPPTTLSCNVSSERTGQTGGM
jgi:hypothetical protein